MKNNFKTKLYDLLKKDSRLWDEEKKELNETLLKDLIDKLDEKLIELLLSEKETKEKFFIKVKDVFVFKQNELKFFIDENKLDNSYTQYQNKIGLRIGNKLLSEWDEVVLDWPFKDCVLEGGMTKEDQKRNEIFFNEILAKDEIDRLFDPKALVNWKRYTAKGEEKIKALKRDKNGTIWENLIIKGNNLLALHSLKEQFTGKVKLIYIDPPYNTKGNKLGYNDNFNHSAWLVFMRNRIKVAQKLLRKDGVMFVQCDDNEQSYLKILMDELFGRNKFVGLLVWQRAKGGGQAKEIVKGHDYILVYKNYTDNLTLKREKSIQKKIIKVDGKEFIKNDDFIRKVFGKYSDKKDPNFDRRCFYEEIEELKGVEKKVEVDKKIKSGEYILEKHNSGNHIVCRLEPLEEAYSTFYSIIKNISEDGSQVISGYLSETGKNALKELNIEGFDYPKPPGLIKLLIKSIMMFDKNGIILDFFGGSGTTAQAVLELNKEGNKEYNFILCEQMDYVDTITKKRVQNVIKKNKYGDFIYLELAKWNEEAKEKILKAKSLTELEKLFDELYERYFLNYNVKTKEFKDKILIEEGFKKLSLNEQKNLFVEMLDMNQMYVNFSERADKKYNLSKEDITLSEEFYNKK